MTSVIASAAQAAHSVAASLLANAQIAPGGTIPTAEVKSTAPDKTSPLTLTGKNILVSHILQRTYPPLGSMVHFSREDR